MYIKCKGSFKKHNNSSVTSENDNKSIAFKFPKSCLMNVAAWLKRIQTRPFSLNTFHLVTSFKSLVIYRLPYPFFFFFVAYLLKKLKILSSRVLYMLDFSDYIPVMPFNTFLCPLLFSCKPVRPRGFSCLQLNNCLKAAHFRAGQLALQGQFRVWIGSRAGKELSSYTLDHLGGICLWFQVNLLNEVRHTKVVTS